MLIQLENREIQNEIFSPYARVPSLRMDTYFKKQLTNGEQEKFG